MVDTNQKTRYNLRYKGVDAYDIGRSDCVSEERKETVQEALGELVGVSRQAVSKWESDRAVPDIQNCIAMSRALGVTTSAGGGGVILNQKRKKSRSSADPLKFI